MALIKIKSLFHIFLKDIISQKKIISDSLYTFGLRGLLIVLQFVVTYFLVRAISVEQYGEYQFILTILGLLTIVTLPGLNNATLQSVARGFLGTYKKTIQYTFLSSCLGGLILCGFGIWFWFEGRTDLAYGFFISAPLFPFYKGLIQWRSLNTGQENFKIHFIYNSLGNIVMSLSMMAAIFYYPGTFVSPLIFLLLVPVLQNLILTAYNLKTLPADSEVEEGIIKYGVKTSIYASATVIANNIEKLLLFAFMSPVALAIYVVANRFSDLFQNLNQDLLIVLAPRFAKLSHYTKKVDEYIKLYALAYSVLIIITSFLILPWVLLFVFGEQYASAIPYAQALLLSVCIGNFATMRFRFIRSRQDAPSHKKVVLTIAVVRVLSAIVLIYFMGILGAVFSVYISKICFMLVVNNVIKKHQVDETAV